MTLRRPRKQHWLISIATAILLTSLDGTSAQTTSTLSALTVPESNLPADCRLRPYVPPTTTTVRDGRTVLTSNGGSAHPFPDNPWTGSERRLLIHIRQMMDGSMMRLPDAPPLSDREMAEMHSHLIAGVLEGYRATYVSGDDVLVHVTAIRFNDPKMATGSTYRDYLGARRDGYDRIVNGPMVIAVVGNSQTDCFRAVAAHIRSLK